MAILNPEQLRFAGKNLIMVLFALPGVGKSTLALSAPNPVIFDCDEGLFRVKPEHRKPAEIKTDYTEILNTLRTLDTNRFKTIILDTVGALIESMKAWAMKTDPLAVKKNGAISQSGFGTVKSEFLRLSAELRAKANVIFVFHAERLKTKEGDFYYDLICEGSAKVVVWQPADLGAYMFVENGKRYLGFSPTSEYSAKSGHGVKGLYEVPELNHGDPNTFLTQMFEQIQAQIALEDDQGAAERERYTEVMVAGQTIVDGVNTIEDIAPAAAKLKALGEALTSTNELRQRMSNRLRELGIVFDRESKKYVHIKPPEPTAPAPDAEVPAAPDTVSAAELPGGGLL